MKSNMTLDYGVRYSLYPPLTEVDNHLATFNPDFYSAANAPKFTTPIGTLVDKTTGSPTNGIMIAGDELAVRRRHLQVPEGQHPAARRLVVGPEVLG